MKKIKNIKKIVAEYKRLAEEKSKLSKSNSNGRRARAIHEASMSGMVVALAPATGEPQWDVWEFLESEANR